jgi:peptidylprolyl isomerase
VIAGQDVVGAIKIGEPVADPQDTITTLRLASDLPAADRPKIQVLDTRGPAFHGQMARALTGRSPASSVCDIPVPTRLPGPQTP